jgi:hypothetical protein
VCFSSYTPTNCIHQKTVPWRGLSLQGWIPTFVGYSTTSVTRQHRLLNIINYSTSSTLSTSEIRRLLRKSKITRPHRLLNLTNLRTLADVFADYLCVFHKFTKQIRSIDRLFLCVLIFSYFMMLSVCVCCCLCCFVSSFKFECIYSYIILILILLMIH